MRVVVTGAAGRLGRVVVPLLEARGHEVRGIDRNPPAEASAGCTRVDLLDREATLAALTAAEAVVHLATAQNSGSSPEDGARQDLAMTSNLVFAVGTHRIRRIVFASSIQVIASEAEEGSPPLPVYLPLDGDSPPRPSNAYARAKLGAEERFRASLDAGAQSVVVLRFPWLVEAGSEWWGRPRRPFGLGESPIHVAQGFSMLSLAGAARVIEAVLRTDLPGFRCYLPAACYLPESVIPSYLKRYYRGVPIRGGRTPTSLIDTSRLEQETGWRLKDVPPEATRRSSLFEDLRRVAANVWGSW